MIAKVRDVLLDHRLGLVGLGAALAGVGILHVAELVPHELADVEPVVEDAGASCGIAVDGGRAPAPAARPGMPIPVEAQRDGPRRSTEPRTSAKMRRTTSASSCVDAAVADLHRPIGPTVPHDIVSIGQATARSPRLHAPAKAATRLVGQVASAQRIHGSLQADVQLADLALRKRDDPHVREAQSLVERSNVLLVATDAVQRLGIDRSNSRVGGIHAAKIGYRV